MISLETQKPTKSLGSPSFDAFVAVLCARGLTVATILTRTVETGPDAGKLVIKHQFQDPDLAVVGALEFMPDKPGFMGIAYVHDSSEENTLKQAWLEHKLSPHLLYAHQPPEA